MANHHVHGDLGDYDGLPDNHMDDPRIAADAAEIAHWNKVEADNGQLTPKVLEQNRYVPNAKPEEITSGTQV
jgi:hypothetical protein